MGAAAASYVLSATAGMGGSLILVPALTLLLGPKEGIALAALLLGLNNVGKVIAYRSSIPFRPAFVLLALTMGGAFLGARLLVLAPENIIRIATGLAIAATFIFERAGRKQAAAASAPLFALGAGATSGFSGTSGPLKGIALKSLALDRMHLVGAASLVSLGGDVIKALVFAEADLFIGSAGIIVLATLPVIPAAAYLGRRINREVGERAYSALFWAVMLGYSIRLVLA